VLGWTGQMRTDRHARRMGVVAPWVVVTWPRPTDPT
jgi:hypothetical protein